MKRLFLVIGVLLFGVISVFALTYEFKIDSSKLSVSSSSKKEMFLENFNENYILSHSISTSNIEDEEKIINLTKKATYLLLGDFNNYNESNEEYYKRHKEYLEMGAYNTFPRDENDVFGYDSSVPGYEFASVSGWVVPSLFLQFDEVGVIYNSYGDIRITEVDDLNIIISSILLPKVKMKEENVSNPREYSIIETDLLITYYFMEVNGEYKLAYLYGETEEDINEYFRELEDVEDKTTMKVASSYDANLKDMYDFSKMESISDEQINNIYNSNKDSIVIFNSYYNNSLVASAHGLFINEGLIVTTWEFLEESLVEAQYIAVKSGDGIAYVIDGIVTANPDTNIAVIKLRERINKKINLADVKDLKVEEPSFVISSKTGVGLTLQKGIIVASDGYIQSSIPLSKTDEGSPLLDYNGNVIGINTAKQINTSISIAVGSDILKEIQDKFSDIDFNAIQTISFDSLKEKFYYTKYNDEVIIKNIPARKWQEYSKIGDIENSIKLELIKASYKDGGVSLRYKNNISSYISSMQLANSFKEQLKKDGYVETLNGSKKCIYKNKKYQVIIMDEFDYLIVVVVKL